MADASDDAAGSASPADEAPVAAERSEVLDQTKEALLDPSTYELLATYLSTVHKKANEDFLTATTAKNYLNSVLQSAFDHCKATWGPIFADTLLFFGCLDPRGTSRIKHDLHRRNAQSAHSPAKPACGSRAQLPRRARVPMIGRAGYTRLGTTPSVGGGRCPEI